MRAHPCLLSSDAKFFSSMSSFDFVDIRNINFSFEVVNLHRLNGILDKFVDVLTNLKAKNQQRKEG